ncbi:HMA2 domain-containing protein [Thalassovita mangrovi]|uniref:Uncharacterized protein n=1 Tax=Thalassovita mangrovi TaxID=2692236 RepID=A0A6L8LJQ1_9RHOB|nr:hypothetical protein [Thalassovita mangrovi]MYM55196.1 hypothetical protein [Thalassovita mangrovi]
MLDDRTGDAADPVKLQLIHASRHRARLKLDTPAGHDALARLADSFASVPGVLRAQVRPNTGSVIVESHSPIAEVLKEAATRGFARIGEKPQAPPVNQVLQMGLMQADLGLKDKTGNALDLRTAIALALIGGAVVQLGRGRIAGPATTLALGALSLLDRTAKRG